METFNYILRRVGQMLIALFVSSIIVFLMIRFIPGNPAQNLLGDFADPDAVAAMEEKMGLNDPYIVQYGIFLRDLVRLDLGDSLKYKTSVASLMGDRMVVTGLLTLVSVIFTVLISMPLGYLAGKKKDSWIDQVIRGFSMVGLARLAAFDPVRRTSESGARLRLGHGLADPHQEPDPAGNHPGYLHFCGADPKPAQQCHRSEGQ